MVLLVPGSALGCRLFVIREIFGHIFFGGKDKKIRQVNIMDNLPILYHGS